MPHTKSHSPAAARLALPFCLLALLALSACAARGTTVHDEFDLVEVATSTVRWTGVAVSQEGTVFVSYPRWTPNIPVSVAKLDPSGNPEPFPNADWNDWRFGMNPAEHFICVQSVYVDRMGMLWVLDPASPQFSGVVPGGAKLVKFDPRTGAHLRTYVFDADTAPANAYLNDVRVDAERGYAYLTDSGAGALVVLDLKSGKARRVLTHTPSTRSEGIAVEIGGRPWLQDGKVPQIHADGVALTPQGDYVYYHALSGRTLYRVSTRALTNWNLPDSEIGRYVEKVADTGPNDGIMFAPDGYLYLSALEENSVQRFSHVTGIETMSCSPYISWPDSFAIGPDGSVYFTTSQIQYGDNPPGPYRLLLLKRKFNAAPPKGEACDFAPPQKATPTP